MTDLNALPALWLGNETCFLQVVISFEEQTLQLAVGRSKAKCGGEPGAKGLAQWGSFSLIKKVGRFKDHEATLWNPRPQPGYI